MRLDGRSFDQLREARITPHFVGSAAGSCLMELGGTRVIVTASVEESVPPFLRGKNQGWLTAEYAMLPASTGQRKARDGVRRDGRGVEISRLIGRSLRKAIDLDRLGPRSITIDCDVLQADGGTRTAAITGGFVALCLAIGKLMKEGLLKESPITSQVAAISCGFLKGQALLDLCYQEDSQAHSDINFVLDEKLQLIEVQGTAEGRAFSLEDLNLLAGLAQQGVAQLFALQRSALAQDARLIGQQQSLVLASDNAHKLAELRQMLGRRYRVLGMREAGFEGEIEETGATFAENARIKAEAVMKATGLLSLADDSGLMVDALAGAPGIHSARYAGRHGDDQANNALLLENMQDENMRAARFVSVLALASPFAPTQLFEGSCEGQVTRAARGRGGFGYDPLFELEDGRTMAEISDVEKNTLNHRARAMDKLLQHLEPSDSDA